MSDSQKFEAFKRQIVETNEAHYGKEIREKYGDKAVDQSNAKVLSMSPEDHARWQSLGDEILSALSAAVQAGEAPAGAEGRRIAELHRQWLSFSWRSYTPQAHAGVAQMYVADPRFTAYYDKEQPGCAAFLRDAILAYTTAQ